MKVSEAMTRMPSVVRPDQRICDAAQLMSERDIGAVPVGDKDRLVGMITDRDIAVRAVARELGPETRVDEVMSREVMYCYDDEDIEHVARNMADIQVRRLPVVSRDKRLVGIIALADLSGCVDMSDLGKSLAGISEPGGAHSQASQ